MLVHYYAIAKQRIDVNALFEPPGSPNVPDIVWEAIIPFLIGIVATWMFEYGIPSYLQGPIAKSMGNIDLSWLVGAIVAGGLAYLALSRRPAHSPTATAGA
jgi:toxin CptA